MEANPGERHEGAIQGSDGSLELRLTLTGDDPVSGSVGLVGGHPQQRFHGWIDLMSVIKALWQPTGGTKRTESGS